MARSTGVRNADYRQTRARLLHSLRKRLLRIGAGKASFRELAECAGVSVPTLRHYFATRTEVVQEVLADLRRDGDRYLLEAARTDLGLRASMHRLAESILASVRLGQMDKLHSLGLTEGLGDEDLGPSYLSSILEPTLQAIESRLDQHQARGELRVVSTRHAALAFAAPLLLATLHQQGLGGNCLRPLDLDAFAKSHVDAFLRAYARPRKP